MTTHYITLKPSEQAVLGAAATIYAGYTSANKVPEGEETTWLQRSLNEAISLAKLTDESIRADGEFN